MLIKIDVKYYVLQDVSGKILIFQQIALKQGEALENQALQAVSS